MIKFQSVFHDANDGMKLHGVYAGVRNPRPVVLCLPGLARTTLDFEPLMSALAEADFCSLALDYRGRGQSGRDSNPQNYSLEREFADLIGFLKAETIEHVVVVGTSRGGFHGMALAALNPKIVKGLVLNDVGPRIEMEGLLRIKSYVGKMRLPVHYYEAVQQLKEFGAKQFTAFSDADWLRMAKTTWGMNGEGKLELLYDPQLSQTLNAFDATKPFPELWPLFEAIAQKPVLVLRGENSDLLSAQSVEKMCALHPLCTSYVCAGQGHAPALADTPTLEVVMKFINQLI